MSWAWLMMRRGIRNLLGIGRSIDGQGGSGEDVLCNAEHSMHRHVTTCHSPFSSSQNSTSRLSAAPLKGIKEAMLYRKANKEWGSVKIWYCIITASRRGSQQVRQHARPRAEAWFRTQPLSWPSTQLNDCLDNLNQPPQPSTITKSAGLLTSQ